MPGYLNPANKYRKEQQDQAQANSLAYQPHSTLQSRKRRRSIFPLYRTHHRIHVGEKKNPNPRPRINKLAMIQLRLA